MAAKKGKNSGGEGNVIVIRRIEEGGGGHHGGAWKIAYADFVTAMMAFFLLMWLLNATTPIQKKGIADYFSPTNVLANAQSGSGLPFGGRTMWSEGSLVSDLSTTSIVHADAPPVHDIEDEETDKVARTQPLRNDADPNHPDQVSAPASAAPGSGIGARLDAGARADVPDGEGDQGAGVPAAQAETKRLEQAAQQIQQMVRSDPALAAIGRQLAVDMTPDGLRIQILDQEKQPMFATGSSALNDRARLLLQKIEPVLQKLPEDISIAGHTDAAPYRGQDRTNWELSSERANATRRFLTDGGVPERRIRSVTGNADRDPLLPSDPMAAENRRIAIVVLRAAAPPAPPPRAGSAAPGGASGAGPQAPVAVPQGPPPPSTGTEAVHAAFPAPPPAPTPQAVAPASSAAPAPAAPQAAVPATPPQAAPAAGAKTP